LLSSGGFAIYRTEVKAYSYLAPLAGHFRRSPRRKRLLDKWMRSEEFLRSGLESGPFGERISEECRSTGDFQRILMTSICERQGATRWADCTPDNILHMEWIHRDFPDAKFIHMLRDGRDVAISLARQGWIRPFPWDAGRQILPAAVFWDWNVEKGRNDGRRIRDNYLEVQYRDLVGQPRETLAVISTFLNDDLDYDRIQSVGIGSVSRPNTSFPAEAEAHQFRPVDRWKRQLGEDQLRLVEALIGPRLLELGYELTDGVSGRLADRVDRRLYRASFSSKVWLKNYSSLCGRFSDSNLLAPPSQQPDESDRTLRPGEHFDYIRNLVSRGDGTSK